MIATCKCVHEGQDSLHGKGKRVFNHVPKKPPTPDEYRCTVCGAVTNKATTLESKK